MKLSLWRLEILTACALAVIGSSPAVNFANARIARSHGALDEIVLSDDFESYQNGRLPVGWMSVDLDNGYSTWFSRYSTWQVYSRVGYSAHSGSRFLMCHFNDNSVPNNDWLILPQQRILNTVTLSYWACSQDAEFPESFQVRLSITGNQPENFTQLIHDQTAVPGVWTFYSHDLSSFADIPFYAAFVYNAANRFALKIDDVQLQGTLPPYGSLAGIVTDDSARPIANVRVRVLSQSGETRTDAAGRYLLSRVSPGDNYLVQFQHEFFNIRAVPQVSVAADDTTIVNASLQPLPLIFRDYVSVNSPRTIVDFDTVAMPLYGIIHDTSVIYDLDASFTIEHTYVGDLNIWLRSPDTVYVRLAAHNPDNAGQNFINCRVSDQAEYPLSFGSAPYTGTWRPLQPLSVYNGDSTVAIRGTRVYSTWQLAVYDSAEQDHGTITGFAIHVASEMPVPVRNRPRLQPDRFAFDGNYPNPFNAQTRLCFYLPRPARVKLALYDLIGREVATLLDRAQEPGEHEVVFSAENLPSGVYFARFSAADFSATRKIVLLK